MSTCPVCCEDYTVKLRKPIECPSCHYAACSSCVKNYILNSTNDADCMSCHHPFDRQFLGMVISRSFMETKYKEHRQNVLVDRDMSFLPATQPMVENYLLAETYAEEVRRADAEITQLTNQLEMLQRLKTQASNRRLWILRSRYASDGQGGSCTPAERRVFMRACPMTDCRGFLSTQWKCGTCACWTCPECHEPLGDVKNVNHVCDPGSLATARVLSRDCKPCPKCASLIHKIDGCSQMWCTQCHTAFSWVTGRVEHGTVHNPHYYAWLREHSATGEIPRNVGDVPCPGDRVRTVHISQLNMALRDARPRIGLESPTANALQAIHREIVHTAALELRRLPELTDLDPEVANRDLRVRYLLKRLDKDGWKRALAIRERDRSRKLELRQVYDMFVTVASDIMMSIVSKARAPIQALQELEEVIFHANTAFRSISKRYNCATKVLKLS